jgi:recombination protein RecT
MSEEGKETKTDRMLVIKKVFEDNENSIIDFMPEGSDHKRMLAGIIMQIRVNPKLMSCTKESIFICALQAMALGVETNPAFQHASLVPYKRKVKIEGFWKEINEAQLQIQYRGFVAMALNTGEISSIETYPVYENEVKQEKFSLEYGLEPKIKHTPVLFGDQGPLVGCYAVCRFKDGNTKFYFMNINEIKKRMEKSQSYQADKIYGNKNSPWDEDNWFIEMAKKTPIKGLCKTLQLSPLKSNLNKAAKLDNLNLAGKSQIPYMSNLIERIGMPVPGLTEENEPDPNKIATINDSDFGIATEGEGDPAIKENDKAFRKQLRDRFLKLSKEEQVYCKTEVGKTRIHVLTLPDHLLEKLKTAVNDCETKYQKKPETINENQSNTEEEVKDLSENKEREVLRNKVADFVQYNESRHEGIRPLLEGVFPDSNIDRAYLNHQNLRDSKIIPDSDIKTINDILIGNGFYE